MGRHNFLCNRQSQTGAAHVGGAGVIQTVELFKDHVQLLLWDRLAKIGDGNTDRVLPFLCLNFNCRSPPRFGMA